jgi:hypothetical protein
MKNFLLVLLLNTTIFASSTFITKYEYGQMLYENPRGIGCKSCHGIKGAGSVIAKYKHNGKEMVLMAPRISNITYDKFLERFKNDYKSKGKTDIMPKYFLTNEELESIYLFLTNN